MVGRVRSCTLTFKNIDNVKVWKTASGCLIYSVLGGRSNSYLLLSENVAVLVDTGKESSYPKLLKNLGGLDFSQKPERILVLSHSHFDHCQNACAFAESFGFNIFVGLAEESCVNQGFTPLPKGTGFVTRFLISIANRYLSSRFGYRPFSPDVLVDDDVVLFENNPNISLLQTPGHSPGSISIIVDEEIALVGDALFGVFPNAVFPPYADDPLRLVDSWTKLLHTKCKLFLPGHGRPISRNLLLKEYKKHGGLSCF